MGTADLPNTIGAIEKKWSKIIPARPFDYFFLDEYFDRQYHTEIRFGRLFYNFAILAILISCLGLLGLASYSTLQRKREIGIRKVLGASVSGIVNLLSKDFLKLVILSFVIGSPIAWFLINKWLQHFAYRIQVGGWVFIVTGLMAFSVALFTVSFQAIKAALANPVNSLRSE